MSVTGHTADPRAPDRLGADNPWVSLFPARAASVPRLVQQRLTDRLFPPRKGTLFNAGDRALYFRAFP